MIPNGVVALFAGVPAYGGADDVARGAYLWQTGQDAAAAELARQAVAAAPGDLAAFRLHAAVEIARGNGATFEAATREWWAESSKDPVRRVALALVLAHRHPEKGGWCDEVTTLVASATEGEPRYWATLADRLREARCVGGTGHADAELRRIAKEKAYGWMDGVLAEVDAGYLKEGLAEKLEEVWTTEPWRLERAGALWRDGVSGPEKGAARHVTTKALEAAAESDDPVLVRAALAAYREAGEDRKAEQTAARLRALDSAADASLVRRLDEVTDPPEYGAIAACTGGYDPQSVLACLDGVAVPEQGSLACWKHAQRATVLAYAGRADDAYAATRAAWQAEPTHRFAARTFASAALARKADLELAVEATAAMLAGRTVPADPTTVAEAVRTALARDLDLRSAVLRAAGRGTEALEPARQAFALAPTAARQVRVGLALAAAGQGDEAVLTLAYGLATEVDDTALLTEGRDALRPLAQAWGRTVSELVEEAARAPGDEDIPPSALVGRPFPDPALLPEPADPKRPGVRVVAAWASWRSDSVAALSRLAAIEKHYAEKGVRLRVIGVDPAEVAAPPDASTDAEWVGPAAMRSLRSVALPLVVVVDAKGTIAAVLAPYDRGSLDLEKAIDRLLPAP